MKRCIRRNAEAAMLLVFSESCHSDHLGLLICVGKIQGRVRPSRQKNAADKLT